MLFVYFLDLSRILCLHPYRQKTLLRSHYDIYGGPFQTNPQFNETSRLVLQLWQLYLVLLLLLSELWHVVSSLLCGLLIMINLEKLEERKKKQYKIHLESLAFSIPGCLAYYGVCHVKN